MHLLRILLCNVVYRICKNKQNVFQMNDLLSSFHHTWESWWISCIMMHQKRRAFTEEVNSHSMSKMKRDAWCIMLHQLFQVCFAYLNDNQFRNTLFTCCKMPKYGKNSSPLCIELNWFTHLEDDIWRLFVYFTDYPIYKGLNVFANFEVNVNDNSKPSYWNT